MNKLLKCELCEYEAKQLFQHIKVKHNMTVEEYRSIFGNDKIMQINFNNEEINIDEYRSNYVKNGYKKLNEKIKEIKNIYNKEETIRLLKYDYFYKNYFGRAKNKTLLAENPKLYKSIYEHSNELEEKMKESGKYKGSYNFRHRLIFIVELNCNVETLKCKCGRIYNWNDHCRLCYYPEHSKGRKLSNHSKLKCRMAKIEAIKNRKGQVLPNYNEKSIPVIEQKAKELGITDLQHAENGGEFHIKELGYWVDGYSKEKNIVIEYDERHHFNKDGTLKERDAIRQKEIENHLGCQFIRIET